MAFINIWNTKDDEPPSKKKDARIEWGVEYNEIEGKEIKIIKVYTPYDPPLIHDYKQLEWRNAQYRPERQDGKVLYWIFAERVLNEVLTILERHNYTILDKELAQRMKEVAIEAKKTFADYELDSGDLKLINEMARPGTARWAERVLREQFNFQQLMDKNPNLDIKFNFDNSREIVVNIKDINATFIVAVPLNYPEQIPVTKLEGMWQDTNYKDSAQVAYFKTLIVACLGDLKKRWKPQMTVAHFIKLFLYYLTALHYSQETPAEAPKKRRRKRR